MSRVITLVLIQFTAVLILLTLRRIAPTFLLFEGIVLSVVLPFVLFIFAYRLPRIKYFFKSIFLNPILSLILSSLIIFNLLFFSLMMIDRSKSLYIIKWVGNSQPISREELFKDIGVIINSNDGRYIKIRIEEQLQRKVITEKNGLLHLTPYGSLLKKSADISAKIFLLNGWEAQDLIHS